MQDADRDRMLRAGIAENDSAETTLDQFAKLGVDLLRVELRAVEFCALVEIDIGRIRVAKAPAGVFDVEKALLGPPEESLGMHSHLMRQAVFFNS